MKNKNIPFDGVEASLEKQRYISGYVQEQKRSCINETLYTKILQDFFKKSLWSTEGKESIWRYHR